MIRHRHHGTLRVDPLNGHSPISMRREGACVRRPEGYSRPFSDVDEPLACKKIGRTVRATMMTDSGARPASASQIRRVNPATGLAEIVAIGVRNSVGGDVDQRTGDYWFTENARDWLRSTNISATRTVTRATFRNRNLPWA
jgi:hypothetical protein